MSSYVSTVVGSTGAVSVEATRRELNPRQAETVEKLAQATREELREVGYDGLTVRSVAGRAQVAPATAYNYFSSKNHLVAEVFWRRLSARPRPESAGGSAADRVIAVLDDLVEFLGEEPELAAASNPAMLGADPDVRHLRVKFGLEVQQRLADALGADADPHVLDTLLMLWSGALLQGGMGYATYEEMGKRMSAAVRLVVGGAR
jgi:AcrR family transcriptional regulator